MENMEMVPKKGNKKMKGLGCGLKKAPLEAQLGWVRLRNRSEEGEVGGKKPPSS